jgi:hypothetical protein
MLSRSMLSSIEQLLTRFKASTQSTRSSLITRAQSKPILPTAYEARPTRMFGAYTVWALYTDGAQRQLAHGTPQHCMAEAARLNAELGDTQGSITSHE